MATIELGLADENMTEKCEFISCGATSIPLPDKSVDVTTAFLVLEHVHESDIDKLYEIESDRLSLANKLEKLAFLIPNEMSLLDFEYNYSKKEIIVILTSDTENDQYEKNISLLKINLKNRTGYFLNQFGSKSDLGIFGDSDFNSFDLKRQKDSHKQQDFYKVILTLTTK